ncbi:hypothetical protein [Sulfurimonas sp.]|uniref:hypothetical protein n=1 Tax=Sulfurimonas sp. TaxID=2022749 RepID=UPI00260B78AE|nr:hypothetical protein [Sulfurimonas sp.]MDD3451762.1 hypothetical protein [Sulfurimonas sp.]
MYSSKELNHFMNLFLNLNKKINFDNNKSNKIIDYLQDIKYITNANKFDYNLSSLKKELENNYNKVSNNNKKFFTYNLLDKYNKNTGEIIENSIIKIDDIENFKYVDDFYLKLDEPIKDFKEIELKNLKYEEKNKGQFLNNQDKLYSYRKLAKVKYLEYIYKDKEKVFITFTLPSEYHKYKKIGNNLVENENYKGGNFIDNIENGLKRLNEIHDYFYNLLKKYVARLIKTKNPINDLENKKEIGFIKILEPHKNLQGHLHSLFYIDKEFLEILDHVYELTIKKFELIQTKKEILKNAKSSTYLNKYLIKTTRDENRFYNEYKRYFSNIRLFTSSNYKYTNQERINLMYRYLGKHRPHLINAYKKSNKPLYYYLELLEKKGFFEFLEGSKETISVDRKKLKEIYYKEVAQEKEKIEILKNLECEYALNGFNNIKKVNKIIDENGQEYKNKDDLINYEKEKERLQNAKKDLEHLENEIIFRTIKQVYKCVNIQKNKQILKAFYKNKEIFNNQEWIYNKNKLNIFKKIVLID